MKNKFTIEIYIEGGGNTVADDALRKAFRKLFDRAGFQGNSLKSIPCGGRGLAFRDFKIGWRKANQNKVCLLLVDSEEPIKLSPWEHLRTRVGDGWQRPENATDENVHFMATCTEAWLIADLDNLKNYFGKGFRENALPPIFDLENRNRNSLEEALKAATKDCRTKFAKGQVCFEILEKVSIDKLQTLSYFRRFIDTLETLLPKIGGSR